MRNRLVLISFGVILVLFASRRPATAATTFVGGNIINQTWTPAGNPYIIQGDIVVPAAASLTIQAGTQVLIASTDGQGAGTDPTRVEIIINGTLHVNGTAASPVTFAAQAGSGPSVWYGIEILSQNAGVTIAHATIGNSVNAISIDGGPATVTNTTISDFSTGSSCQAGPRRSTPTI